MKSWKRKFTAVKAIRNELAELHLRRLGIDVQECPLPVSRVMALARGYPFYFTGKPCRNKHVCERYTKHRNCLACYHDYRQKYERDPVKYHKARAANDVWKRSKPEKYLLSIAKTRAKSKGQKCTITCDDIVIPKCCPILGIELKSGIGLERNGREKARQSSPSLDRIDNTKGYVRGNVQVVSYRANRLKSDMTVDECAKLLKWMKRERDQ